MKKIYFLLLAIVIGFNSYAQLTITKANNQPVIGDVVYNAKFDSTAALPKATGTSQDWNFTSLTPASFTNVTTYTTVLNPGFQSIANIDKISTGANRETYSNQTTDMSFIGYIVSSTVIGLGNFSSNPMISIKWPTSYGTTSSDAFAGTEYSSSSYTDNISGNLSYTASGSGTVTMPGGYKHHDCLQLKKVFTSSVSGTHNYTTTNTTYEYWSSIERYPILTIEYESVQTPTGTAKSSAIFVNTHALTSVPQQQLLIKEAKIFPNPTVDKIFVELPDNEISEQIELFDVNGRSVLLERNTNVVKTSSLNKGLYFVKVKTKNRTLEERIVITD